jgi:hypothetical protein
VPVLISVITIFLECEGSPAIVIRRTKVVIISVIVKVVLATRRLVKVRVVEFYHDFTSFKVFDFVRTLAICHNSNSRLEKQSRQRLSSEMVVIRESDLHLREPFLYCDAQLTLYLSWIWQKQRQNQRLVSPQKNQATWPFCLMNQSPFPEAASPHSMPLWATCPRALRPPAPSATGFQSQVQSDGAAARIGNGKARYSRDQNHRHHQSPDRHLTSAQTMTAKYVHSQARAHTNLPVLDRNHPPSARPWAS